MSDDSAVEDRYLPDALSDNTKNFQIYMTIPATATLAYILRQLGLPPARYRHTVYEDTRTGVAVTFNTSRVIYDGSLVPTTISGIRSTNAAEAENSAAVAAVRFMVNASNIVVKDFNYGQLKQLEEENRSLRNELKKTKFKTKRLGRGWFLSLRHMRSFAAQFHNMAVLGYFGGKQSAHADARTSLLNINGTAQLLKERSNRLQSKLDQVRRSS